MTDTTGYLARQAAPMPGSRTFYYHPAEYTPIVEYNRMCAAMGSPRYAQDAAGADYNGHCYEIVQTLYGYWTVGYMWSGWHVVGRSEDMLECAEAAIKKATMPRFIGGSARISFSARKLPTDYEAGELLTLGYTEERVPSWWTWRHTVAKRSAPDSAKTRDYRVLRVFDPMLLATSENPVEYFTAVCKKHGLKAGDPPADISHW